MESDTNNKRPQGAKESDFSELSYSTVMDLYTNPKVRPEDQQNAYAELTRREEIGELNDVEVDAQEDLAAHDYLINDEGKVLYPSDKVRKMRAEKVLEAIPLEWWDTLEDRIKEAEEAMRAEEAAKAEEAKKTPEKKVKSPEQKAAAVLKTTERLNYEKCTDLYDWKFIDRCKTTVAEKQARQKDKDTNIFRLASEPLMVQYLGGEGSRVNKFLPRGGSYAIWASEYDDEERATDIIYGIDTKDCDWVTCSIDVTTSRDPKVIKDKFNESGFNTHGREIVFCRRGKRNYAEKDAIHFVLGFSKDSFKKMAEDVILDDHNAAIGCLTDKDRDFMAASEFNDQIDMQLAGLGNDKTSDRYKKLKSLKKVMASRLFYTFEKEDLVKNDKGVPTIPYATYARRREEMKKRDDVYAAVMEKTKSMKKDFEDILAGKYDDDDKDKK